MKPVVPTSVLFAIAATSLGLVWGQQNSPLIPPVDATAAPSPLIDPRSLLTIDSSSDLPFVIDPVAADDLKRTYDDAAARDLQQIKRGIMDLVTRYPSSPASKEITEILDKAGLKVVEGYGVYPKNTFVSVIPITR